MAKQSYERELVESAVADMSAEYHGVPKRVHAKGGRCVYFDKETALKSIFGRLKGLED